MSAVLSHDIVVGEQSKPDGEQSSSFCNDSNEERRIQETRKGALVVDDRQVSCGRS